MTEPAARERERDLDRLLTFVDAIVAIAVTLLVLPLVDLSNQIGTHDVAHDLHRHQDEFWAFLLSFYVITRLWLVQHDAVRPLLADNVALVQLLLLWSFTIVVLPFPTALVAGSGTQAIVKVFYVGTVVASSLTVAAIRAVIRRHPELTDGSPVKSPWRGLLSAGLITLALVVMLAFPSTNYAPMLLLTLDSPIAHLVVVLLRRSRSAP